MRYRVTIINLLWLLAIPSVLCAKGTQIWELAGFEELSKGELDGTTVSDKGEVNLGLSAKKLDLEALGLVWSAIADGKGHIYLGTGYDGKIFRVDGTKITHIADTGQLLVTAFAFDKQGDLYAAALPDAVVWRIKDPARIPASKPVKAEAWAKLPEGVKHLFALEFDKQGRTLYAGTGPEGQILAIGSDKKPQIYLDTEEEHILSLAKDTEGQLIAGTSPSALLLRVRGPGRATALADFDATEVKAIVADKEALYVAVNEFKTPPAIPSAGTTPTTSTTTPSGTTPTVKSSTAEGDGQILEIDPLGRSETLWSEKKAHVVSLALSGTGILFAGLGTEGRVISVDRKRLVRNVLDLDERQVMSLIADKKGLGLVGTGDAGALYAVDKARSAEATYLTPLLDTGVVSKWGRMRWIAHGNLKVKTRSGNTETADVNWSDWSSPLKNGEVIASSPGRYLQVSFSFADDPSAGLISTEVAYSPQNLRAVITDFNPGSRFPETKSGTKKSDLKTSDRFIPARPPSENDRELSLNWKVENPDDDELRYQLWYRAIGDSLWRPILEKDKVLKLKTYTWNTASVPEGYYQIRLTADDSLDNDPREVQTDEYISTPVIIDNHQPMVKKLAVKSTGISGTASDDFSAITAVEYSVDNGPFMPVLSQDGIFDEKEESFSFPLPKDLTPGPHAAAVRAVDRGGNFGVGEIHLKK